MGNSSSSVAYALRFALVVLVCLVFGLVLGYSATPAMRWLGKRIAVAETSQPVSLDSYASRRTEPVISAKADSDSPFGRLPFMPLVGDVDADKRFDVNANAVPRQASVDWPLTASPKAVSATSDEGHPPTSTLRAGPNVQDSRSGRPVQTDDLRALSSVRTVTHPGEHRETDPNWDYCGNPQCRLCYPVAGSKVASDLPDMPQGYCKRHPQSRDCKPIVVPAPKPLPKATDPPVIASAGLGAVSRETLAWVLVCVFFVAWLVSGFEVHKLRKRQTVSDFRDTVEAAGLARVRRLVQDWLDKQGHDRCWYYPEIFTELARALDLQHIVLKPPQLPSLAEFKAGCERYQREQYPHAGIRDFQLDNCQIVIGKTTFRSKIRITVDTTESIVLIEPIALQELFTVALASCHGSKCVKCGAQSEGLSEPCKLTHYGVHDLGPMPMCVVKGCTAECYDPTAREGLCWQHEYPSTLKKRIERLLAAGATPKIPEAVMRDMPIWSEAIKRKHLPVIRPLSVSEGHIPEAARCDPSDLCALHKPCAKHGGKPGAAILDEQSNSDYVGVVKEVKPPSAPTQPTNSDERGTDKT